MKSGSTIKLPLRNDFHESIDHEEADLLILRNKNNFQAAVTNYGARWVSMLVPKDEGSVNVLSGFNSLDEYVQSSEPYYGAVLGRYANLIAGGKMHIGEKLYQLPLNQFPHHFNGGSRGFHSVLWEIVEAYDHKVTLEYLSPDGEENYPGNLKVRISYSLTDDDLMEIWVHAETDAETHVNISSHSYFNLNGSGSILDHELLIKADYFTPVNEILVPTGEISPVIQTPFDFREAKRIGQSIRENSLQLNDTGGYDHNFVLIKNEPFSLAASVQGNLSDIRMDIYTLEPGLQFSSGNQLKGDNLLSNGYKDESQTAFSLAAQHFPDSPNHPSFPSTLLKPGEVYETKTAFRFSIKK